MTDSSEPEPDPLAFTPVVTGSTRHDGWTPDRQRRFIEALAAIGVVARAAQAVGKSATAAYNLRKRPDAAELARAWDVAQQMGQDHQFGRIMERALEGYEAPRFYAGRQVGTVRRFENRLAIAVLRAMDLSAPAPVASEHDAYALWLLAGDPDLPPPATPANTPPITPSSTSSADPGAVNTGPIQPSSTSSGPHRPG